MCFYGRGAKCNLMRTFLGDARPFTRHLGVSSRDQRTGSDWVPLGANHPGQDGPGSASGTSEFFSACV